MRKVDWYIQKIKEPLIKNQIVVTPFLLWASNGSHFYLNGEVAIIQIIYNIILYGSLAFYIDICGLRIIVPINYEIFIYIHMLASLSMMLSLT
jgi:hypothetical protein